MAERRSDFEDGSAPAKRQKMSTEPTDPKLNPYLAHMYESPSTNGYSNGYKSTSENKPLHTSPSTGFHKPKPKSPTRPAKLPASMTAPTTSSLSKVATAAAPSRQSLGQTTKTVSRSRSYASLSQKQELHHKPSKLDSDRPTLGRPSTSTLKKQLSRQSLSKQTAPADESFLARMMRPTTSSASKTTEKIITPPRAKTNTRPTTRDGPADHKSHQGLKGSPSTKKLPAVAKETKKEGLNAAHSDEVEGIAASASGISQDEPNHTEKEEAAIPSTAEDEPVATSTHEDEHMEEVPAEDGTAFVPGFALATEDTVGANRPVEPLISKDPKPNIEASQSVEEKSNTENVVVPEPSAERVVVSEEPKNPASKFVEETVHSDVRVVADEPKVIEPTAHSGEDQAAMNSVPDQSKEESEVEDTATAA